ncbi:NtaA/DmoA family FMN-dependent monooxygenase [Gordonia soli]|uniref:Putative FMNH2-dependent monooxygenase n=1 Tax=Gordonia soli NBRC 108243 TaxID=1223545 RepID=M0QHG8_9ACTN|nr:NtaA/DmoA family FMN-dependent monooxygenase [Gordonia soli]GAC67864.1 putative FMNH2-dependent monooxygenase [Gordonia soli NBRC 108243]
MSSDARRHAILNVNLIPGGIIGSPWRRAPEGGAYFSTVEHYLSVARVAERGLLDAVFLADSPDLQARDWNAPARLLDPIVAQSVVAAQTERIGLIVTATTSYNDPYHLARQFASLAAVSHGRVGWNFVVTGGDAAARLHSADEALPKADRYRRAEKFVEVVTDLWDSWQPGALSADVETGRFLDPRAIRAIAHDSKHFRVSGRFKAPPLDDGRPILIQAGASTHGVALGARAADAVYCAHSDIDDARRRRDEVRALAAAAGRDPDAVKLLPGLIIVLADTEEAARRRQDELIDLIPDEVQITNLAARLDVPIEVLELDGPLPWDLIPADGTVSGARAQREVLLEFVRRRNLDTRGAARLLASGGQHVTVVGTPEQVADHIEDWFRSGACDGFNLMLDELPHGLEVFVDEVVPILQRRGLFRTQYTTSTLRGHFGL